MNRAGADLASKAAALDARLASLGSVLVAYSGGVDSAFLGEVLDETPGFDGEIARPDFGRNLSKHRNSLQKAKT